MRTHKYTPHALTPGYHGATPSCLTLGPFFEAAESSDVAESAIGATRELLTGDVTTFGRAHCVPTNRSALYKPASAISMDWRRANVPRS